MTVAVGSLVTSHTYREITFTAAILNILGVDLNYKTYVKECAYAPQLIGENRFAETQKIQGIAAVVGLQTHNSIFNDTKIGPLLEG